MDHQQAIPLKVYKSDEYLVEYRKDMTDKELDELRANKVVNKALKSSSWGLIAAAIKEKQLRVTRAFVGWDGINIEKAEDKNKVGRIVSDQKNELKTLKDMRLVQNTLRSEPIARERAFNLFMLKPGAIRLKQKAKNVIISNRTSVDYSEVIQESVHVDSQALVGTVFSVPSKRKRVLERLKPVHDLTSRSNPSPSSIRRNRTRSKNRKLSKEAVKFSVQDEQLSDGSTIEALSEHEDNIPPVNTPSPLLIQNSTSSDPSQLQQTSTKATSHSAAAVQLSLEDSCYSSEESEFPQVMRSRRMVATDSSQSSFDSSSCHYTSQSSCNSQSSLSYSASIDSTDNEISNVLTANTVTFSMSSSIEETTLSESNPDDIPTVPPLTSEAPPTTKRESWYWLDSYTCHLIRSESEDSVDSTSPVEFYGSVKSPEISDSAFNTPAVHGGHHPLSNDSSDEVKVKRRTSLSSSICDDPNFAKYCEQLDHKATADDYVSYKLILLSEKIEEKYGRQIESAIQEAFMIALKDKFFYIDYAKISHRLALQAEYVQEQAILITCLGRRLYEKLPYLESIISSYTAKVVEEMAEEFLLRLSWSGDNPRHNPEIIWDYDDWPILVNNKNEVLAENVLPQPEISLKLRRVNSVEVLTDRSIQTPPTDTLALPISRLVCRRHSLSFTGYHGNTDSPTNSSDPSDKSTERNGHVINHVTDHMTEDNGAIIKATNAQQVTEHLEKTRSQSFPSKPVILSLRSQTSTSSSVSSSIRTISARCSTSSEPSSVTEYGNNMDEIVEEDVPQDTFDSEATNVTTGRRRSSVQVISDVITSPVMTVGLPLAVVIALALK